MPRKHGGSRTVPTVAESKPSNDLSTIRANHETRGSPRAVLQEFISIVGADLEVPTTLLRQVAQLVELRLDDIAPAPAHRPRRGRADDLFAWFAVNCDPLFCNLPRTRDKRYTEVAEMLGVGVTTVQRREKSFGRPRASDSIHLIYFGEAYAIRRGMEWNNQTIQQLLDWLNDGRRRRSADRKKAA